MKPAKTVYVVLGPYRSGTSMVSRLVTGLGVSAGPQTDLYEATDWNPAGYIQRPDITHFNTQLIERAGGSLSEPAHPEKIARCADASDFSRLDLSWMEGDSAVLLKDPRFCYTLYTWWSHWQRLGWTLRLVRVSRSLEAAATSALAHYDVRHYCHNRRDTAYRVLRSYDEHAAWHCRVLPVESMHISFERLLDDPESTVGRLAEFLRVDDVEAIAAARHGMAVGRSRVDNLADSAIRS